MNPLAYHILARLDEHGPPLPMDVDQKAAKPDFATSQDVPDFVRDQLPIVVRREFALTPPAVGDDQEPITEDAYQSFWLEQVSNTPWGIYAIADAMADRFDINSGWAFKTTRQHLNQLVLQARMRGYREEDSLVGRRFRWGGPDPEHPACEWIMDQIPDEGLPYHEVVELMGEAKQRFVEDPPSSSHVVHDWCRHEIREVT